MVTVTLSMLSGHNQSLLRDVLKSVGVVLPEKGSLYLNVVCGHGNARARSVEVGPGAARVRERSVEVGPGAARMRSVDESARDTLLSVFPALSSLNFLSRWRYKKSPIGKILRVIRSCFCLEDLYAYLESKLGLVNLVEFAFLDFLYSCVLLRNQSMEIDVFVRFAEGFYNQDDDCLFYKHAISLLPTDSTISYRDARVLVSQIFRNHSGADVVVETLDFELGQRGQHVFVEPMYIVYISLWVFHHQHVPNNAISQHGFDIRDSIDVHPTAAGNLIDRYVDSIISLKEQTKLARESQVQVTQRARIEERMHTQQDAFSQHENRVHIPPQREERMHAPAQHGERMHAPAQHGERVHAHQDTFAHQREERMHIPSQNQKPVHSHPQHDKRVHVHPQHEERVHAHPQREERMHAHSELEDRSPNEMEEVIARVLARACEVHCGTLSVFPMADALLQKVLLLSNKSKEFEKCVQSRNDLMEIVSKSSSEALINEALWKFCVSIATEVGGRRHV